MFSRFDLLPMPSMTIVSRHGLAVFACCLGLVLTWLCVASSHGDQAGAHSASTASAPEALAAEGVENLWKLPIAHGKFLFSGGQPQGDAGFQFLKTIGIQTVISVDGARPDLESAAKHGMRYVHLPIGYDDVPRDRRIALIQAVRQLPGPVFVHCHHGKHRGPSAAVCIWRGLAPNITAEQGVQALRVMGTAENYRGLYRAVEQRPPTARETKAQRATFPEFSDIRPLAEEMVAMDLDWERLLHLGSQTSLSTEQAQRIQELLAGLSERFQESARLLEHESGGSSDVLRHWLQDAAREIPSFDPSSGERQGLSMLRADLVRLKQRCAACHSRFRDESSNP